jgi:hypothetical protein
MMPKDVSASSEGYEPAYSAARAWTETLTQVLKKVGLRSCPTKPSIFHGATHGEKMCVLCYVDDLLLVGSARGIEVVKTVLNKELKVKEAGRIDAGKTGSLKFLWREIQRGAEGSI